MKFKWKLPRTYMKYALTFIVSGVVLILFYRFTENPGSFGNVFSTITGVLQPFIIGLVLAYLLCPIYNGTVRLFYKFLNKFFKNKNVPLWMGRITATFVAMSMLFIFVGGFMWIVIPEVVNSIIGISQVLPDRVEDFINWAEVTLASQPEIQEYVMNLIHETSVSLTTLIDEFISNDISNILLGISSGILFTFNTVINIFVGLIICVYALNSKETFKAQSKKIILALSSEDRSNKILDFWRYTNQTFGGFINGKIIDSIIIGILCYILMLLLKLPFAVLISVVIGFTNIIPFFGPLFGAIPTSIIIFLVDPIQTITFLIMVLALQQFDGNILGPAILGEKTGLASFWVMFAIIVGGGFFGFTGMLLGVPLFAVLYYYIGQYLESKLESKELPCQTSDYVDYSRYGIEKGDLNKDEKK